MAEKLVILRLIADDLDAEGGIGKRLQYNADELNYILGHKGQTKGKLLGKSRGILPRLRMSSKVIILIFCNWI